MENSLYFYKIKVERVIDGDSLEVNIDLGFNIILRGQKIRLYGIDTPEIKGAERVLGLASKDRLKALIEGKEVILESHKDKTEKYGRWLGIIHYKNDLNGDFINVNEQLITEGLAKRYIL